MNRKIRITIGEKSFEGELLEDFSPKTCAALIESLPLEAEVTHAAWSGENLFVIYKPEELKGKFVPENQTIYGARGDLLWWINPEIHELYIPYGQAQYRYKSGDLPANLFGRITGDLNGLAELGKNIQMEGSRKSRVELA